MNNNMREILAQALANEQKKKAESKSLGFIADNFWPVIHATVLAWWIFYHPTMTGAQVVREWAWVYGLIVTVIIGVCIVCYVWLFMRREWIKNENKSGDKK